MPGIIDNPRRRPAALSLVNSAITPDADSERWELGFDFSPEACGDADVADPCQSSPRVPTVRPASLHWEPFVVWAADQCSAFGWAVANYEERARRLLERCESKQIARELWRGDLAQDRGWANKRLADPASDEVTDGATPVIDALACLEQFLAECGCGEQGMIHATPQLVTHWAALGQSVLRREGGLLLTIHDTIVVTDAGYDGSGPDGEDPAVTGVQWAYATSMVTVRRGPVATLPGSLAEALDREDNTVAYYAERPAISYWDGCCLGAAEVDLAPCTIGGAS